MTENTEATPLPPDPNQPSGIDLGESQEQPITEEYYETSEEARKKILDEE